MTIFKMENKIIPRFINRDDVVVWIKTQTNRRSIRRAIDEGTVEFLGGFSALSSINLPGWICRITSIYNRVWFIGITSIGNLYYLDRVPWSSWIGYKSENPLYIGDQPNNYLQYKKDARKTETNE